MTEDDRRLSGAYAADAVNGQERAAHEALVREDPELAEETRSLTETVSELSRITEQAPPAHLRADVLNAIKSVRPLPPITDDEPSRPSSGTAVSRPAGGTAADDHPDADADALVDGTVDRDADDPADDVDSGLRAESHVVTDAPGVGDALTGTPSVRQVPDELTRRRSHRFRATWLGAIAAAAAAALVAVVVILGQRDNAPMNQAEAVISASDVSSQTATVNDWSATLYLSHSQEKAVIASEEMPDAPAGRDFQVWLMHTDGTITSAGVMPHTGGGGQEYLVTGIGNQVRMIAVSEEPAGGSTQPTTEPLLVIEVS